MYVQVLLSATLLVCLLGTSLGDTPSDYSSVLAVVETLRSLPSSTLVPESKPYTFEEFGIEVKYGNSTALVSSGTEVEWALANHTILLPQTVFGLRTDGDTFLNSWEKKACSTPSFCSRRATKAVCACKESYIVSSVVGLFDSSGVLPDPKPTKAGNGRRLNDITHQHNVNPCAGIDLERVDVGTGTSWQVPNYIGSGYTTANVIDDHYMCGHNGIYFTRRRLNPYCRYKFLPRSAVTAIYYDTCQIEAISTVGVGYYTEDGASELTYGGTNIATLDAGIDVRLYGHNTC